MNRREMLRSSGAVAGASVLGGAGPLAELLAAPVGLPASSDPEPFRISIGRDRIRELHHRIDAMQWPEMSFETGWSAGTNDRVLRDLVLYWRREYDWFRAQDELNQMPHFTLPIEGERVHFVWYRGAGERQRFPLLLMHGWPSSFLEFREGAAMLVRGMVGRPGFDLIVPSLPGFLFSEAPGQPGMHPGRIAERMHLLMRALGYDRYGVIGSDWGGNIAMDLVRTHTEAIVGLHKGGVPDWEEPKDRDPTVEERAFLEAKEQFRSHDLGYFGLQATKPQTLAYALQDSPVGLAAWFLEKWWRWIDHDDDLWSVVHRDTFLTTTTLYWLTGSVLSSLRIYYENRRWASQDRASGPIIVPTRFAGFPGDPFTSAPRSLVVPGDYANIVSISEQSRGGHFAAMEQPQTWAEDVAAFFSRL